MAPSLPHTPMNPHQDRHLPCPTKQLNHHGCKLHVDHTRERYSPICFPPHNSPLPPPPPTIILRAACHNALLSHVGHVANQLANQLLADLGSDGQPAGGQQTILIGNHLEAGGKRRGGQSVGSHLQILDPMDSRLAVLIGNHLAEDQVWGGKGGENKVWIKCSHSHASMRATPH